MSQQTCFFVSVAFSFIAWVIVTRLYIVPRMRPLGRAAALQHLLIPHIFRFIGLSFLVPGVVSPGLPVAFTHPAAYGDLLANILALLALATLRYRIGVVVAWIFNLWGAADLVNAPYQAVHAGFESGVFGTDFFIPTLIVPILLILHGLIFWILLRRPMR